MAQSVTTSHSVRAEEEAPGANSPLRELLASASRDWRTSERRIVILCALPFVVLIAGAAAALLGKATYKWFTAEDGFAETLQVVFYLGALVLCVRLLPRMHRTRSSLVFVLYWVLALGLVFLIGEEVSWGQRIFGWGTPAALAEVNKQAETNLHNIYGAGAAFKWIQLLVGAYGTVLPVWVLFRTPSGKLRELTDSIVPPLSLAPFFAPMFAWKLFRNLFAVPQRLYFVVEKYNEVVELVLALGMFLFLVYQWRRPRHGDRSSTA